MEVRGQRRSVLFERRGWKGGVKAVKLQLMTNDRTSKDKLRHEHLAIRSNAVCNGDGKELLLQGNVRCWFRTVLDFVMKGRGTGTTW